MIPRDPIIRIPKRRGRTPAGEDKYVSVPLKVPPDISQWFKAQPPGFNRNAFIVSALAAAITEIAIEELREQQK